MTTLLPSWEFAMYVSILKVLRSPTVCRSFNLIELRVSQITWPPILFLVVPINVQ